MSKEARELVKQRMVEAKADMYEIRSQALRLLQNVYANPTDAFKKMCRFEGTDADLVKKIQESPASFGTLLGYRSVGEYFSLDGAQLRKMSGSIAKDLPGMISTLSQAEHKYFDLKSAYEGRDAEMPSLTRGKGGLEM